MVRIRFYDIQTHGCLNSFGALRPCVIYIVWLAGWWWMFYLLQLALPAWLSAPFRLAVVARVIEWSWYAWELWLPSFAWLALRDGCLRSPSSLSSCGWLWSKSLLRLIVFVPIVRYWFVVFFQKIARSSGWFFYMLIARSRPLIVCIVWLASAGWLSAES